jgi:hypothetical protein
MSKQGGRKGSKTLRVAGRGGIFRDRLISNYPPETGHNSNSGCQPNRGDSTRQNSWYSRFFPDARPPLIFAYLSLIASIVRWDHVANGNRGSFGRHICTPAAKSSDSPMPAHGHGPGWHPLSTSTSIHFAVSIVPSRMKCSTLSGSSCARSAADLVKPPPHGQSDRGRPRVADGCTSFSARWIPTCRATAIGRGLIVL